MNRKKVTSGDVTWAIGQFRTVGVTILCGVSPDEGKIPVNTLDILELTEDRLVMAMLRPVRVNGKLHTFGCSFLRIDEVIIS